MKIALIMWWKNPKALSMFVVGSIINALYIVASNYFIQVVPNVFNEGGDFNLVIALLGSQVICLMAGNYLMSKSKGMVVTYTTVVFNEKMLYVKPKFFTKNSVADIYSAEKFSQNIIRIGDTMADIVNCVLNVVITMISIALIGGSVIVPVVVVYIIAGIVIRQLFKLLDELANKVNDAIDERMQELENIVSGFKLIRVFNTQENHRQFLIDNAHKIFGYHMKKNKVNTITNGAIKLLEVVGIILVIGSAKQQVNQGIIDSAVAMSLVMYITRIMQPIIDAIDMVGSMSDLLSRASQWEYVINYEEENVTERDQELNSFKNKIVLKGVNFSYADSEQILKDINMTIPKGKKIAIVGESGGGKSTLFNLLNRFYEADSGEIIIDDIPISKITNKTYAARIGCVLQDTVIFPGTIKDNIMCVNPDASEDKLIEAAKQAHIYDFIVNQPRGFNEPVGPDGVTLSGGQKQRIALARIFLKKPDIILMDEATSALDNTSEKLVKQTIAELEDKTIITIAHRLSTIQDYDCIYVIHNHEIAECGTHDELMKKENGIYAAMVKAQMDNN